MKRKKVLTNGYSSRRRRKEILGFDVIVGVPKEDWNKDNAKDNTQIKNDHVFMCKCGRTIIEHPIMRVGNHYYSLPYYGDLCPYVTIGEIKRPA